MKALKLALLAVLGLLILFAAGAAFILNSIVSGGAKETLAAKASEALGAKVTLDRYALDYASIFKLQPAIALEGLAVANPAGFASRNVIEAGKVEALVDLRDAMSKKVHVTSLRILEPKILLETAADGRTNLDAILEKKQPAAPASSAGTPEGSASLTATVDRVEIVNGVISLAGAKRASPAAALTNFNLALDDVYTGRAMKMNLSANLYGGANSTLKADGLLGPLSTPGLPIEAKTEIRIVPAELPAEVRQRVLGELSSAPGPSSKMALDLALTGKLAEAATGKGRIEFTQFLIGGQNQKDRLALSGQTPVEIAAQNLLAGQSIDLRANNATLKLGGGQWNGNLQMIRSGEKLQGGINGAIRNVDVNQMLTSFAATPNKVYGTLTIPRFALNFEGQNAAEIQNSMNGNGQLTIANGKFQGLSVLASIERALGGSAKSQGEFAQFSTNFTIRNRTIGLQGISAAGPGIDLSGAGTVGFNEALNFKLNSKLTGNSAAMLNTSTRGMIGPNTVVPVFITGTLSNPQVQPQVGSLMKSAATNAVQGILGNFLNRKKK